MCGIVGIIDPQRPAHLHEPAVRRMVHVLRHRGPDDQGSWQGRHAVLGHTRLSLLDREGGAQPMLDVSGRYVLVYNGEVYNHAELRNELRERWTFRTRSDTEVVLAALTAWGEDALPRFNGMFALCWWDEHEQRGLLARDRLGVKPLAYQRVEGGLRFASEAKALVAVMPQRPRPNVNALLEVLAAPCMSGVAAPAFAGLEYLQPGELLRIDRRGMQAHPWAPLRVLADRDDDELEPQLRAAMQLAVRRTLRADVPVGVFLSGGLDSTLVAALAAAEASEPPRALTIAFDGQHAYDYARSRIVISDDTPFARLAAQRLGLRHTWVHAPTASIARTLPELARIDDAVPAWEQQLAQHHLAHAAALHDKAVLVGDAADETHYGYHFLLDDRANRSPLALLRRFPSAPIHPDWGDPALGSDVQARFARDYERLLRAHGHDPDDRDDRAPHAARARVLATTWLVLRRWLPRLLHNGDVHTMAASLEARVPFADTELCDLALRVDPRRALASGEDKALLRRAVQGLLPEEIRVRRKSALPKDQRTAELYKALVSEHLREDPGLLTALCDEAELRALLRPDRRLDEGERAVLFRVAALASWQRAYDVAPP
ncbi:asparagine synthase (glutamine-hydrolyzing) [Paraliomyxa miuraensis]|uniref:asparagine synthase (glutamine-hydrolyzing) n=1 Tax=Paraliomyxa miuraensis TaxID=376150 RepID=UPI0022594778|nr:asparagine synthase (glutamine-hydrolyzing) [Paraliomyxa miuraensis]MCX4245029.1 asparagine synthase (glutamine-hydrolyzing) [Paraliomyxa miuraensis]